jgi:pyruvate dehydrogenase E1 component beta subunit
MPKQMTYGQALLAAVDEIMEQDNRVVLFNPGFIGMEAGQQELAALRKKYASRIKFPPIAEIGFCGIAIGAAMAGLRPLVDISTATFSYEAIPQIVNEAAIAYSNSGGQTNVPVVFYLKFGIRGGGGVQHSGSPQSWYWNTPGLQIVMPSTPADAKGLMRTVLTKSEDPTIFFGHDRLLDDVGAVPDGVYEIPLGKADIKRAGRDVTIIATSIQVPRALAAAETLVSGGRNEAHRRSSPAAAGPLASKVRRRSATVLIEPAPRVITTSPGCAIRVSAGATSSSRGTT